MSPAPWTSGLVELAFDEPSSAKNTGSALLRRAASREDWAAVRALRFAAMVRDGDLAPSALPPAADPQDGAAGSSTFLLAEQGRVLGATRCSHASAGSPSPLPAARAFGEEIDARIGRAAVVEAGLTVVDRAADRAQSMLRLFKAHMTACAALDAEWLVAAVAERQMGFYCRVFEMEILSGAAPVQGLALPRVLMGLRYRERASVLHRRHPFLAPTGDEVRRYVSGADLVFDARDAGSIATRVHAAAGDARA
ncbi:MAG TPA: hypothetical protein VLY46_00780 [Usitatibacter sp.]|nr:hypothetical protein [Usitatibacter sp.]